MVIPVAALIIYLSNNKSMGFYCTEGPIYSREGAYTRVDLYSEVSGISIVFHCCNQAITEPVHIQGV